MNNLVKILFLFLLFFQTADAKTDWPNWGGPNRDFRVNDAGIFPSGQPYALKIVWKKPLGAGYSPISILGDLAVTMYSDETSDYVIGLNTTDGSERWKYKIGTAYLGHYGSQSGPLSTPIVTEDKVIALGPRGNYSHSMQIQERTLEDRPRCNPSCNSAILGLYIIPNFTRQSPDRSNGRNTCSLRL